MTAGLGPHARKTVVLTHEWRRYAATRDLRARDHLILAYSPLVKYVAGRMVRGMPSHVELGDLVSFGLGGLMQAVERFDSTRGIKFESYAQTRIRGAIVDGIRSMDWIPRRIRNEARLVAEASEVLSTRLQRMPTDAELAKQLSMAETDFARTLRRVSNLAVAPLDELLAPEDGLTMTLLDTLPDPSAEDPADCADARDLRDHIAAAIAKLPEQQRIVMGLRYQQELSLDEIGEILGVSESRACQIHTYAVRDLRVSLTAEQMTPHAA